MKTGAQLAQARIALGAARPREAPTVPPANGSRRSSSQFGSLATSSTNAAVAREGQRDLRALEVVGAGRQRPDCQASDDGGRDRARATAQHSRADRRRARSP